MNNEISLEFLKRGTILSKDKENLLIGWGERTWGFNPVTQDGPNFYFPDFFLKIGMPWFTHQHWLEISTSEFKTLFLKRKQLSLEWKMPVASLNIFEAGFKELQNKFKKKELTKAVPYLFEETISKMSLEKLEHSLSHALDYITKYPAFIYGLWDQDEGFLGATPEILFDQTDPLTINTSAIAGTYASVDVEPLIDSKLLQEHKIVVDGITSSLSPFATLALKPVERLKLSKLTHLVTPICAELHEPLDFKKITEVLHPTPALGAFPKDKGMLFLEQYQMQIPRGRFGCVAGFTFQNHARCLVAIRNVQWDKKGMKIGAGVGVVQESVLKEELFEINLKLNAIKEIFQL